MGRNRAVPGGDLLAYSQNLTQRYGLVPEKSRGQHFLVDSDVVAAMVAAARLSATDTVVEVGPGLATLTRSLLAAGATVIAVEIDRQFQPLLEKEASAFAKGYGGLQVVWGNVLDCPLRSLAGDDPYKIIASLPYNITARFFRHFLWNEPLPQSITVLVQAEVAERVCAVPGAMSLLSLAVQLKGAPKIIRYVEPVSFWPAPAVRSAILHVAVAPRPLANADQVWRTARIGFAARRKQLKNNLAAGFHVTAGQASDWLEAVGISVQARAQELGVEDWVGLAGVIER